MWFHADSWQKPNISLRLNKDEEKMSKKQNKNKTLTSASRIPDLHVCQSFCQDQFPTQLGFTPNKLVLGWAKALDKTVKVTAVSITPGETCSEASLIIQFRTWLPVVTWDLSFTNKLDLNFGKTWISSAEMPKQNASSTKNIQMEKENSVSQMAKNDIQFLFSFWH